MTSQPYSASSPNRMADALDMELPITTHEMTLADHSDGRTIMWELPASSALAHTVNKVFGDTSYSGEDGRMRTRRSYCECICLTVSHLRRLTRDDLPATDYSDIDLWRLRLTTDHLQQVEGWLRSFRASRHWPASRQITLVELQEAINNHAREPAQGDPEVPEWTPSYRARSSGAHPRGPAADAHIAPPAPTAAPRSTRSTRARSTAAASVWHGK